MERWKKQLSLILASILLLGFLAACAGDSRTPSSEQNGDEGEIVQITMSLMDITGKAQAGAQRIEDALNALTEPAIGVHVNLLFFEYGNLHNQTALMIAGGEDLDICNPVGEFSSRYAQGMRMEIGDLLEQYAPETSANWHISLVL